MLLWWQWHRASFRPTEFLSCLTPSFYWWHFAPHRHPGSHAGWPFSHQIRRDVVERWTPSAVSHCWQIRTMVGVWLESIRITNWGRNPTLSANSRIKFRLEVEEAFKKQNNQQSSMRRIASKFLFYFKDFNVICNCFPNRSNDARHF